MTPAKAIVAGFSDKVFRLAYSMPADRASAEEAAQETPLRLEGAPEIPWRGAGLDMDLCDRQEPVPDRAETERLVAHDVDSVAAPRRIGHEVLAAVRRASRWPELIDLAEWAAWLVICPVLVLRIAPLPPLTWW